jgi:short-subunit dehydrogenase
MTGRSFNRIRGSVIVVCGASSGIGRGAAIELAGRGARLVLMARRQDVLVDLVIKLREAGTEAIVVPGDISRESDVAAVAQAAIEEFGQIDIWINDVGVGALGLFWQVPAADQARVIDVNLRGLMYGSHFALSQFVSQGRGTLINVGSIDSEVPLAYQTTYAATKAAVLSLGRSLNEELRLCGLEGAIKVSTLMPWAVDTPWWTHAANYTGHAPRMANMDDPALVVDALVQACRDPQEEITVGPKAKVSDWLHHVFPGLVERLSAGFVQRELQKGDPLPGSPGSIHHPSGGPASVDGGIRTRMRAEDKRRS